MLVWYFHEAHQMVSTMVLYINNEGKRNKEALRASSQFKKNEQKITISCSRYLRRYEELKG